MVLLVWVWQTVPVYGCVTPAIWLQEELLYKYPVTAYPDVDEITNAVIPFQNLFNVVFKWQKAEKK